MTRCPKTLPEVKPGENAVSNHLVSARIYHRCRNKVDGWIDWYQRTEGGDK